MTHPRRLARKCALLVLVLVAVVTPGCQFLQNEFFFLCPAHPGAQQAPEGSGPPAPQRHQQP